MELDLAPLLARAFHSAEASHANVAIAEAREKLGEARSYEVLVPDRPDDDWLSEGFLKKLVYFCESTRAPLPGCPGVFVSFFAGDRLHCVLASEVIAFACDRLATTSEDLVRRYGTGEVRHALRGD